MQINLVNTSAGWQAETTIELEQQLVLIIRTARSQGRLAALVTHATVATRCDDSILIHDLGNGSRLGDYDEMVASRPCMMFWQLTEKPVHEQHDKALAAMPVIRARIEQHYRQGEPLGNVACREELGASHG